MNVFKLEGFLVFFSRIFLKMFSEESFFFPGEEMVTLKLFSFLPAHSQEIAKSSKVMGWFDDSSFFFQYSDVDEEIRCFRSRS